MITKTSLRSAWNAFIALLNIEFDQLMCCPECGDFPQTIVIDGHALGLRKHLLAAMPPPPPTSTDVALEGSRHEDRLLVPSQGIRERLRRYVIIKIVFYLIEKNVQIRNGQR